MRTETVSGFDTVRSEQRAMRTDLGTECARCERRSDRISAGCSGSCSVGLSRCSAGSAAPWLTDLAGCDGALNIAGARVGRRRVLRHHPGRAGALAPMAARAQMGMNNLILVRFSAAVLPHLCEKSRLGRLQNPPPLLSTASPVCMTHAGRNLPAARLSHAPRADDDERALGGILARGYFFRFSDWQLQDLAYSAQIGRPRPHPTAFPEVYADVADANALSEISRRIDRVQSAHREDSGPGLACEATGELLRGQTGSLGP